MSAGGGRVDTQPRATRTQQFEPIRIIEDDGALFLKIARQKQLLLCNSSPEFVNFRSHGATASTFSGASRVGGHHAWGCSRDKMWLLTAEGRVAGSRDTAERPSTTKESSAPGTRRSGQSMASCSLWKQRTERALG